jgi:LacI family transcriptional regulator
MALGVIYAAQDAGLKVPGDLAVVGFDNQSIASMNRPSITTVTMPSYDMGHEAAELLLGRMEGKLHEARRIRGKLIVRQSCGSTNPTPTTKTPNRRFSLLENKTYDIRDTFETRSDRASEAFERR